MSFWLLVPFIGHVFIQPFWVTSGQNVAKIVVSPKSEADIASKRSYPATVTAGYRNSHSPVKPAPQAACCAVVGTSASGRGRRWDSCFWQHCQMRASTKTLGIKTSNLDGLTDVLQFVLVFFCKHPLKKEKEIKNHFKSESLQVPKVG